jgi:putative oligomerization/nucleic acid binding protein
MMMRRRRPIMRAAMVGGTAYAVGKHAQRGQSQEAEQEARLEYLEAQQQYAPPPQAQAAPAGGMSDTAIEQLTKLGQLHEQGVLTDAEFEAQKQKILG